MTARATEGYQGNRLASFISTALAKPRCAYAAQCKSEPGDRIGNVIVGKGVARGEDAGEAQDRRHDGRHGNPGLRLRQPLRQRVRQPGAYAHLERDVKISVSRTEA